MGILYHVIKNQNYEAEKIKSLATAWADSVESKEKPKTEGGQEGE